ncbi:hypothetical protein A6F65_01802 [Paraurantiacibacter namhicola]|uniref:UrcA family protein n=2 Tax=Paraurantiacibacter namhicola TaxID=645517 RepID=A0A1C7D9J4_9SPHN|nr:hypothetical protein A6F65_01802 [Paraurantiacibacter namhicola]
MRKGMIAIAAAALSIGFAPHVAAQNMEYGAYDKPTGAASPPTGNFYPHSQRATTFEVEHGSEPDSAYLAALEFTNCVQRNSPDRITKFLAQPIGSRAERWAARRMMQHAPGCHSQAMVTSLSLLRSAAKETLARSPAS